MNFLKRNNLIIIALILTLSVISIPSFSEAKSALDGVRSGNVGPGGLENIKQLINNVRTIILSVVAALTVLFIIIGGVLYITSAGNEERTKKGKQYLTYAIYGLILVILAEVIIRIFASLLGGSYES